MDSTCTHCHIFSLWLFLTHDIACSQSLELLRIVFIYWFLLLVSICLLACLFVLCVCVRLVIYFCVFHFLASATFSANTPLSTVVYDADVTDPENDPVIMTLTCDPTSCPFLINNGKREIDNSYKLDLDCCTIIFWTWFLKYIVPWSLYCIHLFVLLFEHPI